MKKVMVVDDSPTVRCIINDRLTGDGYQVVEAESGQQALDYLKENSIDCLITDLNMPRMDGIELASNMRQLPGFRFVPIVMLSSEDKVEHYTHAKKSGISTWIEKPFDERKLSRLVGTMINN